MLCETILWLALNIYHESRSEPDTIQIAVAHVTINRSKQENSTIKKIVNKKKQFSWTNNKKKLRSKPWVKDPEVFLNCSINAVRALNKSDITKGATHYHEKRIRPKWAKDMQRTAKVGPFIFYKEKRNE